jgi:hypothetical protein
MEKIQEGAPDVLNDLARLLPVFRAARLDWFTERELVLSKGEPKTRVRPKLRALRNALIEWQRTYGLLPDATSEAPLDWFRRVGLSALSEWAGNERAREALELGFPEVLFPDQALGWLPPPPPEGLPEWNIGNTSREAYLKMVRQRAEEAFEAAFDGTLEAAIRESQRTRLGRDYARQRIAEAVKRSCYAMRKAGVKLTPGEMHLETIKERTEEAVEAVIEATIQAAVEAAIPDRALLRLGKKDAINSIVGKAEIYCNEVTKAAKKQGGKVPPPKRTFTRDLEWTVKVRCRPLKQGQDVFDALWYGLTPEEKSEIKMKRKRKNKSTSEAAMKDAFIREAKTAVRRMLRLLELPLTPTFKDKGAAKETSSLMNKAS